MHTETTLLTCAHWRIAFLTVRPQIEAECVQ